MWSVLEFARAPSRRRLRCSFCGRRDTEVNRLVAGASAFICDDCIAKCVTVLHDNGGFVTDHTDRSN
ncbi:MAG TPA: ClpX C4-type zinc finger protein [Xanthobacteraceae bacterium]|jgi:ATP-dependent protease Clp ATPase subunit|nr:ClpX C4-type zinc finger protein [Xanthobacteraceae bacterium]